LCAGLNSIYATVQPQTSQPKASVAVAYAKTVTPVASTKAVGPTATSTPAVPTKTAIPSLEVIATPTSTPKPTQVICPAEDLLIGQNWRPYEGVTVGSSPYKLFPPYPKSNRRVPVNGPPQFIDAVCRLMSELRQKTPEHYQEMLAYMPRIVYVKGSSIGGATARSDGSFAIDGSNFNTFVFVAAHELGHNLNDVRYGDSSENAANAYATTVTKNLGYTPLLWRSTTPLPASYDPMVNTCRDFDRLSRITQWVQQKLGDSYRPASAEDVVLTFNRLSCGGDW
jgi:hypothetical protein